MSGPWLIEALIEGGGDFGALISKPLLLEAVKVKGCGIGAVIYKPRIKSSELKADHS